MRRGPALLLAGAAGLMACAPALRPLPPASGAPDAGPAALSAEVLALARRIEHEPDRSRREALVAQAVEAGQRCDAAAPGSAPCDYALGVALGLQARERPSTASDGLPRMAALLRRAAAADPALDRSGPDRVLALLLLRAPGWPLGPGDPDAGLEAARRAAARFPEHAPNQLALAEALLQGDDAAGGRAAARRALALAEGAEAGEEDAADWARQARTLAGGR